MCPGEPKRVHRLSQIFDEIVEIKPLCGNLGFAQAPPSVGDRPKILGQRRRYSIERMGPAPRPVYQDHGVTVPAPIEIVQSNSIDVEEPVLMR